MVSWGAVAGSHRGHAPEAATPLPKPHTSFPTSPAPAAGARALQSGDEQLCAGGVGGFPSLSPRLLRPLRDSQNRPSWQVLGAGPEPTGAGASALRNGTGLGAEGGPSGDGRSPGSQRRGSRAVPPVLRAPGNHA